mmetsp:Transcript_24501/g.37465  ORF Transcript_24501/g.37465 Transcript_24501/m.37465 type:complete len:82 (+) Transcript_24501:42-287(+)
MCISILHSFLLSSCCNNSYLQLSPSCSELTGGIGNLTPLYHELSFGLLLLRILYCHGARRSMWFILWLFTSAAKNREEESC